MTPSSIDPIDFERVSVILPLLNEENYIENTVSAILSQDYHGELEVILAVGPSKDRTRAIADEMKLRDSRIIVIDNPSGKTAAGLNLAIAQSRFPIIVRVDGHAEIPRQYISRAVKLLQETGAVNVGGMMAAIGVTPFERAVASAMRSPLGVGASRFHTGGNPGAVDTVYLGVFLRDALLAAGGFDERFTRAQDWELNFRLRKLGGVIYFDPQLQVAYRPRPKLSGVSKQYFEYGRWRRVVSRRHRGTVNLRYLAPPFALVVSAISILGALIFSPYWIIPAAIYGAFLAIASLAIGKDLGEKFRLPFILFTMHMSWGAGFLTSSRKLVPTQ
ncbi:MAG: glycosyltransferase family 2 protein [Actinomycetota bacterium]